MHGLFHLVTIDLWAAVLIAVFFGGSIFFHELGHFLAARLTGMHVDRFSIGFGPAIWSWRGKDGVEYRLAWFPLGGYVLLPQLADMGAIEGKSSTDLSKLPPPSFPAKMITLVAGALFNVLFALGLAVILFAVGVPQQRDLSTPRIGYVFKQFEMAGGKSVPTPAAAAGLQAGDIIKSVDGTPIHDWTDMTELVKLSGGRSPSGQPQVRFVVERDGHDFPVTVQPLLLGDVEIGQDKNGMIEEVAGKPLAGGADRYRQIGISQYNTMTLHTIAPGSPAAQAGLRPGDEFKSVGGQPVYSMFTLLDALHSHLHQALPVQVIRGSETVNLVLTPTAPAGGGSVAKDSPDPVATATGLTEFTRPIVTVHPSPFQQVWDQVVVTWRTVVSLVNPHSDVGLSKMSGIIGIIQVYHEVAPEGMIPVLELTILLNVNLAILNLLPIPVLDGGHMLFATIGWLRGRSLPINFIIATQSVFMVLIVILMVYIGYFDVLRWPHG